MRRPLCGSCRQSRDHKFVRPTTETLSPCRTGCIRSRTSPMSAVCHRSAARTCGDYMLIAGTRRLRLVVSGFTIAHLIVDLRPRVFGPALMPRRRVWRGARTGQELRRRSALSGGEAVGFADAVAGIRRYAGPGSILPAASARRGRQLPRGFSRYARRRSPCTCGRRARPPIRSETAFYTGGIVWSSRPYRRRFPASCA